MRKSYIFSMAIILIALVGMMIAADMALKPVKAAIAIGGDLGAMLEARGDIQQGSIGCQLSGQPDHFGIRVNTECFPPAVITNRLQGG